MSTIKNSQISLYCHFKKIIKWSRTVSGIEPKTCYKWLSYNTLVFDQISF